MPTSLGRLGRLEAVRWRHRGLGWAGKMSFATRSWQRWAVRAGATVRRAERVCAILSGGSNDAIRGDGTGGQWGVAMAAYRGLGVAVNRARRIWLRAGN